ncbi:MAG: class I SAM-dependent methyltransferase [archaeon]
MQSDEQKINQIKMQLDAHSNTSIYQDIRITSKNVLYGFAVHRNVLNPKKVTALFLSQWLASHNELYRNKDVIDMGCGSGIQGIVMGLQGANKITFADISEYAINNTKDNVIEYGLVEDSRIVQGDLFENINDKSDIIVFNHPFFIGNYDKNKPVSISMVDNGSLLHRFFNDAKDFLRDNGLIIMPYFHFAGLENDPGIQIKMHPEYSLIDKHTENINTELHKGPASIYQIELK